jgi:hypothetical protein
MGPPCGHEINSFDGSKRYDKIVSARIALHTNRFIWEKYRERLADGVIQVPAP